MGTLSSYLAWMELMFELLLVVTIYLYSVYASLIALNLYTQLGNLLEGFTEQMIDWQTEAIA